MNNSKFPIYTTGAKKVMKKFLFVDNLDPFIHLEATT